MSSKDIFVTTHPSLVPRLLHDQPGIRDDAWLHFIRRYEEPLTFCVRGLLRGVPGAPPADDLTRSFFGHLLIHGVLAKWDRQRGALRAYVQGVLRRFVAGSLRELRGAESEDFEVLLDRADPTFVTELHRRWAYQVFALALHSLGRHEPRLADVWVRLQGIAWLRTDATTWRVLSYEQAVGDQLLERASPTTVHELAQEHRVAVGTVHNWKYEANSQLLGYIVAEVKRHHPDLEVGPAVAATLELLVPLVPELRTLRRRQLPGNGEGSPASQEE